MLWSFLLPSQFTDDECQLRHCRFILPGVSVLCLRGLYSIGEYGAVVIASVSLRRSSTTVTCYQGACIKKLSRKPKLEDSKATKQVVALLSAPLDKYDDIVTALTLSNYPCVMDHLDVGTNNVMAMVIIRSIMKFKTCVSTSDKVLLIKGLIMDLEGIFIDELDEEDFNEEQNSVACLMHVLYNDDPEEMLNIICTVWKHVKAGGPKRLPSTVPPLMFSSLKLVRQLQDQDGDVAGEEVPATPSSKHQHIRV